MPTINPHYVPPAATGQNADALPPRLLPAASHPSPSSSSGPNWSTPPTPPYQAPQTHASAPGSGPNAKPSAPTQPTERQGDKAVKELDALLTPENIEELVQNPGSDKSRAILAQLRPLLTAANISSYLRGPNADANAKTLEKIGERLEKSKLDTCEKSCLKGLGDKHLQQAKFRNLEMLFKAFDAQLDDFANFLSSSDESLKTLKTRVSGTKANTKELNEFGGHLSKGKIEKMRRASPSDQS